MSREKLSDHELISCHATYLAKDKSWAETALSLGLTKSSVQRRLEAYKDRFGEAAPAGDTEREYNEDPIVFCTFDDVIAKLRKQPMTLAEMAPLLGIKESAALALIYKEQARGLNIHKSGDRFSIQKIPALRVAGADARHELFSDDNNEFRFGFVTDNHIGSKYSRLDVLNDLYDRFAKRGITQVFNAGNYIDGEARFNIHDLEDDAHGMDAQLRKLSREYPQRPGIKTYFVAGDDHEGWYAQRNCIEIGMWTERVMKENGREDFIYLGYMEADIDLINVRTEKSSRMRVVHPGGGSAYAISYTMQKIVESYEGGDKPAVVLGGHYHKMDILNYRGTWCIQGGTTEDQTPFMRKKKLEAHVGGLIITLEQDPVTGAIIRCNDMMRYFNRAYYRKPGAKKGERFSYGGKVTMPARSLGGV